MRTLIAALCFAAVTAPGPAAVAGKTGPRAAPGGAAVVDPPGIQACFDPRRKTRHEIDACMDKLVTAADEALDRDYRRAMAGLDADSQALLKASEDAFRAWLVLDNEAASGIPAGTGDGGPELRQMAAFTNALTIRRERRDEIRRLYLGE